MPLKVDLNTFYVQTHFCQGAVTLGTVITLP